MHSLILIVCLLKINGSVDKIHGMEFTEAVKTVLTRRRKERELPQRELAYLCGLDPVTISRIERGEHPPSLSTFWLLAKGLSTTASALAKEIDTLTSEPTLVEEPPPAGYRKTRLPSKESKRHRNQ